MVGTGATARKSSASTGNGSTGKRMRNRALRWSPSAPFMRKGESHHMNHKTPNRGWTLLLRSAAIAALLALAALGRPEATNAVVGGCAEMISCGSEAYCEFAERASCEEGDCEGAVVCVTDIHDECLDDFAGCQDGSCKVILCAEWRH
jgi:hypothetical protein